MDILFVTPRPPDPAGGGDRATHALRHLSARGRVWLASPADGPVSPAARAALGRLCHRAEFVPAGGVTRRVRAAWSLLCGRSGGEGADCPPALTRLVRAWLDDNNFGAAVATSVTVARCLRPAADRGVRVAVDRAVEQPGLWEGGRLRLAEQRLMAWASLVTLPDGVDVDYFRPVTRFNPAEPACVFAGDMSDPTDAEAAERFARSVWPHVRAARPDAEFWVVGPDPAPSVLKLQALPGVRVTGAVPDVRPYLHRAAVSVAASRAGLITAMAAGRAAVSDPTTLLAASARDGREALAAESPGEWSAAVLRLLGDEPLRARLAAAARNCAESRHRWADSLRGLSEALGLPEPVAARAGAA